MGLLSIWSLNVYHHVYWVACGKICNSKCTLQWHTHDNDLGLCAHQNILIDLGSILNIIEKLILVIIQNAQESSLWPRIILAYSHQSWNQETTIFVICDCYSDKTIHQPIEQSKVYVELKMMPAAGPHALPYFLHTSIQAYGS